MPAVIDRIPTTAYHADAALGTRRSLSLGSGTVLRREDDGVSIGLRYQGPRLATYHQNGDVTIHVANRPWTRAKVDRLARVLPAGWTYAFRGSYFAPSLRLWDEEIIEFHTDLRFTSSGVRMPDYGDRFSREWLEEAVTERRASRNGRPEPTPPRRRRSRPSPLRTLRAALEMSPLPPRDAVGIAPDPAPPNAREIEAAWLSLGAAQAPDMAEAVQHSGFYTFVWDELLHDFVSVEVAAPTLPLEA